jgi:3-isopropylmalate/(R)-2-methylmalate dehydratase large subunit
VNRTTPPTTRPTTEPPTQPRTLYDKIWDQHLVVRGTDTPSILYIDLHLIHEVTSPQAFAGLKKRGLPLRRPDLTVATADHVTPTVSRNVTDSGPLAVEQVGQLEANCREFGVELFGMGHDRRGIVHVIGPELGLTQPGKTIVCGDSHTSTHGAFGALAFGIGTTEVEHVMATQCLLEGKAKNFKVDFNGKLRPGVTAKDAVLKLISRIGVAGGAGHVIEYTGSGMADLDMDGRMTICNMSIEAGARAGLLAPDQTTYNYMTGRPYAPSGKDWDAAMERWSALVTDDGAVFDRAETIDTAALEPMISFGTNPAMCAEIGTTVPDPEKIEDLAERAQLEAALEYMDIRPGSVLQGQKIDVVFIGSCTNSRMSDLRAAAGIFRGRKVSPGVRALVVPGSQQTREAAESEGLDRIFMDAGAEWRESGCSMCIAMNGDRLEPGQRSVSTSNRNFEGRQGQNGRTMLASPLTAAAAAVTGKVTDPRTLMEN